MKKTASRITAWRIAQYLAFMLLLHSCGEKKFDCKYLPQNPEMVMGTSFKSGSYFVFRDTATLTLDSFLVYYQRTDSFCDPYRGNTGVELRYGMENSLGKKIAFASNSWSIQGSLGDIEKIMFLHSPFEAGTIVTLPSSFDSLYYFELHARHESIQIADSVYTRVYQITSNHLSADRSDTTSIETFYSPTKGLLKFSIRNPGLPSQVWELVGQHIVR